MMMVVVVVNVHLVFFITLFMCSQSYKKSNPTFVDEIDIDANRCVSVCLGAP